MILIISFVRFLLTYQGLCYFTFNRELWGIFIEHVLPMIFVSITLSITASIIYFSIVVISGGTLSGVHPAILQITAFITDLINRQFILPRPLKMTFDYVIGKEIDADYFILRHGMLGDYLPGYYGETILGQGVRDFKRSFSIQCWIGREVLYFMINLIPFLGPFIVAILRASRVGFAKHRRYFDLKGYSHAQINYIWCWKRHLYFCFGFWCALLEMIPGLNMLFFFTNNIGAALWAIDLEKQGAKIREMQVKQQHSLVERIEKIEKVTHL